MPRLSPPGDHLPASDLAGLLRAGGVRLGHRPAVTVLHPFARYEQSGVSLANWAAKGAHLLELDHLVAPSAVVDLDAPACWTTASVCLAAWWLGGAVRLPAPGGGASTEVAAVTVRHERDAATSGDPGDVLLVGDGLDGGPTGVTAHPIWTREAQPLPDAPPPSAAAPDLPALLHGDDRLTQAEVIALAGSLGDGVLGVEVDQVDPLVAIVATAVRPLLTGHATVVLRGVARDAASAERISAWCGSSGG